MKILNKLLLVFALVLPVVLYAETWQRVLPAYVDNIYLAGAYSGSVNYSRPAWVDIDGDNDYDFFIGGEHGGMHFYRNNGTPSSPSWTFVTEFYKNIDVGNRSSQTFVDIDADNDYDLFIGNQDGWIAFYRNVGSSTVDTFVLVSSNYLGIDVGSYSAPWFCDIDADGDKDMFIGCQTGTIYYYRNDGTPSTPNFVYVTNNWFSIDIGTRSIPCFADINADGDFDLFIGWAEGTVYYYRNDGTPTTPNMVYVTDSFTTDLGNTTAPSFVDIDNDGDLDMFVGEYIGNVNFYRNTGSATNPNMSYVRRHYVDIDMNSSSTPTFVDIDNDGDYDMFAGEWVGIIDYYQNSGTATNHRWTIVSENYAGIDVGDNSAPTFVDIDADNDFDLFIGNLEGNIYYYRNDGNATTPNFTLVSSNYNSIDVGDRAAPDFIDIDNDNDFDLFIGNNDGVIWFYRNTGTPSVPSWTLVSSNYNNIDVGERAIPYFADVDRDGDFDLFIGEYWGTTFFYRNTGTPSVPAWTFVTNTFAGINVEENTAPTFVDIDNDNDLDLFIGERWGGLNLYLQIVDLTPPKPPFITRVEKIGNNVRLTWNKVTQDTLNNVEKMRHYLVYRKNTPDYIPSTADSIGIALVPDTTYTDINAVPASQSYYYLVKAVDSSANKSYPSNMGFKFNKFLNENPTTTDMNWVSLPYLKTYSTVSNITSEMSPNGTSIVQLTNLRQDQYYEDWFYVGGIGWMGTNFTIDKGLGYEFVVAKDTTPVITGAHDPNFRVPLVENPAKTDMTWVSVPYNAVYSSVSNITNEYSPSGNPLIQVTNLRADQYYEDWFYVAGIGWMGTNFTIERGCAYEFVVSADTSWKPTVYTNRGGAIYRNEPQKYIQKENRYREPVWRPNVEINGLAKGEQSSLRFPHLVILKCKSGYATKNIEDITFTAYCLNHPEKALFEGSVGCGIEKVKENAIVWAQFGNLPQPWVTDEEAVIIVEIRDNDRSYFGIQRFKLDATQNPQIIEGIEFVPLPVVEMVKNYDGYNLRWNDLEVGAIIGYGVYQNGSRLNENIVAENSYAVKTIGSYEVRPVFIGGYETALTTTGLSAIDSDWNRPNSFSFMLTTSNPNRGNVQLKYELPVDSKVEIVIYDITGRLIRRLFKGTKESGYHSSFWSGDDESGTLVPSGIYFIELKASELRVNRKIILQR